jgi:hypothetical protein
MTLTLCVPTVNAQEKLPLKLIATTPMPGFAGDFDHFGLDLKGSRLFLASEDQKTVEVFELRTGERIHSIKGFGQPLTMAYLAESNRLIVADRGDIDAVELVDCKEYKIINTLKLGPGVDHGVHNSVNKYFYVENGGGPEGKTNVLSIIDTKSFTQVGEVAELPGSSNEGIVIDHKGKNLPAEPVACHSSCHPRYWLRNSVLQEHRSTCSHRSTLAAVCFRTARQSELGCLLV